MVDLSKWASLLRFLFLLPIIFASGCSSSEFGDRRLNSRFVYAKSTVTPLRNVSATAKDSGLLSCGFTRDDYETTYDDALSQDPNANILLDYYVNYETTQIFLFCTSKLTISGLAAAAEIR